jgi:hypothetical protein
MIVLLYYILEIRLRKIKFLNEETKHFVQFVQCLDGYTMLDTWNQIKRFHMTYIQSHWLSLTDGFLAANHGDCVFVIP